MVAVFERGGAISIPHFFSVKSALFTRQNFLLSGFFEGFFFIFPFMCSSNIVFT